MRPKLLTLFVSLVSPCYYRVSIDMQCLAKNSMASRCSCICIYAPVFVSRYIPLSCSFHTYLYHNFHINSKLTGCILITMQRPVAAHILFLFLSLPPALPCPPLCLD